jgi:hypothetical protein
MNTSITRRKLAVITAGLVLTATASVGHTQQKWMEQVLEQSLQEQAVVKEGGEKHKSGQQGKTTETADESPRPQNAAPKDIDISNLYDDEGNPLI